MKVIILCGGLGTRLSEETQIKPKPMVEIGGKPILWHIMKIYESHGIKDFLLALGYKGDYIKDYFINYHVRTSDFNVNLKSGIINYKNENAEDWNVSLIDTGYSTLTGGRLLRLKELINPNETFMLTYGDGVANINITNLINFHKSHGKVCTVTAVRPPARFGGMTINNSIVNNFKEKPQSGEGWINGGFFVFNYEIFNYLENDQTVLEQKPLEKLSNENQLMAFEHDGYWQCMDTLRDKESLENLWNANIKPWLNK